MSDLIEMLTPFPYSFIVGKHYEPPSGEWLNKYPSTIKSGQILLELPGGIWVAYSGVFNELGQNFGVLSIPAQNNVGVRRCKHFRHGVLDVKTGMLYFFFGGKVKALDREQAKTLFDALLKQFGEQDPVTGFRKNQFLFALRDNPFYQK